MVPVGIEERILRRSPPTPAKAVILAVLISASIKSHITIAFAECGRHTIATTQTQGGPDEGRIHASFANENTDPQSETEELYDLLCGHSQPGAFLQCVSSPIITCVRHVMYTSACGAYPHQGCTNIVIHTASLTNLPRLPLSQSLGCLKTIISLHFVHLPFSSWPCCR